MCLYHSVYGGQRPTWGSWFPPPTTWGPRIRFRLLVLAASTFTCWAILGASLCFFFFFLGRVFIEARVASRLWSSHTAYTITPSLKTSFSSKISIFFFFWYSDVISHLLSKCMLAARMLRLSATGIESNKKRLVIKVGRRVSRKYRLGRQVAGQVPAAGKRLGMYL